MEQYSILKILLKVEILLKRGNFSNPNWENVVKKINDEFILAIAHEEDKNECEAIKAAHQVWIDGGSKIDHLFEFKIYPFGTSDSSIRKYTLLHFAAERGCKNVVRILLNAKAEVDPLSGLKCTPLHLAALSGHEEVVKILLKNGANINAQSNNGNTPLHLAAQYGYENVVKVLIAAKAKVDVLGGLDKRTTALHLAAEHGHVNIVKTLLEAEAKVNALRVYKRTSLHLAAKNGHKEVVEALIKEGADINAQDDDGNTPLHLAYFNNHTKVISYLESQGADASLKNKNDWVPSDYSNKGITKLLKEAEEEILKSVKLGVIFGVITSAVVASLIGMSLVGIYSTIALGTIGIAALPIAVFIALLPIAIGVGMGFCVYMSNLSTEIKGKNIEWYAPRGEEILIWSKNIEGKNVEQYEPKGEQILSTEIGGEKVEQCASRTVRT